MPLAGSERNDGSTGMLLPLLLVLPRAGAAKNGDVLCVLSSEPVAGGVPLRDCRVFAARVVPSAAVPVCSAPSKAFFGVAWLLELDDMAGRLVGLVETDEFVLAVEELDAVLLCAPCCPCIPLDEEGPAPKAGRRLVLFSAEEEDAVLESLERCVRSVSGGGRTAVEKDSMRWEEVRRSGSFANGALAEEAFEDVLFDIARVIPLAAFLSTYGIAGASLLPARSIGIKFSKTLLLPPVLLALSVCRAWTIICMRFIIELPLLEFPAVAAMSASAFVDRA